MTAPPDKTAANQTRGVILYFGNDWYADNRTSSHHIARGLSQHYRVYYIDCPGLRAPRRSKRDLSRIFRKLYRFFSGPREVEKNIMVCTLVQAPFHRFSLMRRLNRLWLLFILKLLIWTAGIKNFITWFTVPHLSGVVGGLGEDLSVYYCIDDYAGLPDVDQNAVRLMDEELTKKADLVFVSAESLYHRKIPLNPRTIQSPHGVDTEHFGKAQLPETPVPEDVRGLASPVVGFFGLIEEWIDLDLIRHLAESRPAWNFLMIGRVAVPEENLPRLPNLHFLGRRPYESLPGYGKHFDATIIPFRLTPVIIHANPLKLREYLAMGKPVVSVSTPEIDKYADVVLIGRTPEEFLGQLDAVLSKPDLREEINRRLGRVASESWNAKIERILEIVEGGLASRRASCGTSASVGSAPVKNSELPAETSSSPS